MVSHCIGERGGVPISKEENINNNKDNGNVIRKMKEGNNIQKKKRG
jgi:hypothetical protein